MALLPRRSEEEHPLTALQREVNRLFDGFFGGDWLTARLGRPGEWAPALDLAETDTSVVVKAEVPGMDAKELDITITGDVLTIRGGKKEEKEEKTKTFHRVERRSGSFSRSVQMPCAVDAARVEANYKDGILTIDLPKKEAAKRKAIQVKVNK